MEESGVERTESRREPSLSQKIFQYRKRIFEDFKFIFKVVRVFWIRQEKVFSLNAQIHVFCIEEHLAHLKLGTPVKMGFLKNAIAWIIVMRFFAVVVSGSGFIERESFESRAYFVQFFCVFFNKEFAFFIGKIRGN